MTATVLRIVDGDTLCLTSRAVPPSLRLPIRVRLAGVFAPELPTPEGIEARSALAALWPPGTRLRITRLALDRYGRWVCAVAAAPPRHAAPPAATARGSPRSP